MGDYYSLQKLAEVAPIGDFLHCSDEAKAREEFVKAVIELFVDDVGMARKLLGELLSLRAQHSNLVFRNKVLRERHDLPVDRLPVHDAVVALQAERDQLKAENERLAANVKLNLCDHPAIHKGDVDLLIAFVSGASQIELAKVQGCTPPNISRKIRRVKGRLGWREGMSVVEIRARAEQLRALGRQGAVVTADLMAENEALREEVELDNKLIADRDRLLNMFECPDHGQCIPYAMEQVEALRKDAGRYRWLRIGGYLHTQWRHMPDQAIDAAMGKGAQS